MNLRTYDYECDCGVWEDIVEYEQRDKIRCVKCGQGERLMCAPVIQTLESHMRGFKGERSQGVDGQGYWNPGFGEFKDENLTDPNTGEPAVYSSLKEKRDLLKKYGKYERGDVDQSATIGPKKKRSERPMIFTNEGSKRGQLG